MTTFTWTGTGGDEDWSNAGNWTSGGPPGALDTADIDVAATINAGSGGSHATVESAEFSDDDLLKGTLQTTGGLTVAGASAILTVNANAAIDASNADPGTASLSVDGGGQLDDTGAITETQGGVEVGYAGVGTLSLYDDGVATFDNTTFAALTLGQTTTGDGTVGVTGAGSTLTINDSGFNDGYGGQGDVDVFEGGLLTANDGIYLGSLANSEGQLFVELADKSVDATVSVTAGAFDVGVGGEGLVTIGYQGVVDDQSNFGVDIASLYGGSGSVDDSGSFTVANEVTVGDGGQGTLDVDSGGEAAFGSLDIAAQSTSGITNKNTPSIVTVTTSTGNPLVAALAVTHAITVGDGGYGEMLIKNSGTVSAASLDVAKQSTSGASGVTHDKSVANIPDPSEVSLSGGGSLTIAGAATVGDAGYGELDDVGASTTTIGSDLVIASQSTSGSVANSAPSSVQVDGAGSHITVTGSTTVADGGYGALSVTNGANFTTDGATMEIAGQNGSIGGVTVANKNSALHAEALVIGGTSSAAGGAGSLTANTGGTVDVTSVRMWSGTISVDGQSLVSIGAGAATVTTGVDVQSGASLTGYGSITGSTENDGEITASSGVLKLNGAVSGGGGELINTGATLAFSSSIAAGQTVTFGAGGGSNWGTLDLTGEGTGLTLAAPVSGFAGTGGSASTSDVIEVTGSGGTDHVVWTQTSALQGALQVENSSNGVLETLTLDGSYNQTQFVVTHPAAADQITYTACYARGTRILSDRGEIAVEVLRIGDRVVTASGGLRPVVWLGHRQIDIGRHRDPAAVRPVRVSAGAFGDGLPRRDLWLSPGHNVASEGALMPISCLINGRSVAQFDQDTVEYWHVELDAHDVMLAEGLLAESYLDCGNRTAFANGGDFVEAHPDFQPKHWAATCLPLVSEGPAVARTKARLLSRLAEEGQGINQEADAHILVDGARIDPVRLSERRLVFALPAGGREIALRSDVFIPAHVAPESADRRELGLCIKRLQVDGSEVVLGSEDASAGWQEAEFVEGRFQFRWTTGATPLSPGARIVVADLAGLGHYWMKSNRRAAARSA